MKNDLLTKSLLFVIAIALSAIAIRPYIHPDPARADSSPYPFHIEPGVRMLRAPDGSKQALGLVAIDMRNGTIWGFPTYSPDPYPAPGSDTKPQVSHPFQLGKFAFEDTDK
jgi:hypothetical protein